MDSSNSSPPNASIFGEDDLIMEPMPLPLTPATSLDSGGSSPGGPSTNATIIIDDSDDDNDIFGRKGFKSITEATKTMVQEVRPIDLTQEESEPDKSKWTVEKLMVKSLDMQHKKSLKSRKTVVSENGSPMAARTSQGPRPPKTPKNPKASGQMKVKKPKQLDAFDRLQEENNVSTVPASKAKKSFNKLMAEAPKRTDNTVDDDQLSAALVAVGDAPTAAKRAAMNRKDAQDAKEAEDYHRSWVDKVRTENPDWSEDEISDRVEFIKKGRANYAHHKKLNRQNERAANKANAAGKKGKKRARDDDDSDYSSDDTVDGPKAKKAKKGAVAGQRKEYANPNPNNLPLDSDQPCLVYQVYSTPFIQHALEFDNSHIREGDPYLTKEKAMELVVTKIRKLEDASVDQAFNTESYPRDINGKIWGRKVTLADGRYCVWWVAQENVRFKQINPAKYGGKKLSKEFMKRYQSQYHVISYRTMFLEEDAEEDAAPVVVMEHEGMFESLQQANERSAEVFESYLLPTDDAKQRTQIMETSQGMREEVLVPNYVDCDAEELGADFYHIRVEVKQSQVQGAIALGEGLERI